MMQFIQIFVSFPSKKDAEKCINKLLKERVAGCIQLFPIRSSYIWKGKIENEKEWLCIIKTKKRLFSKVEKSIKETHPYEVPEIISIPILKGNKEYLTWLKEETI